VPPEPGNFSALGMLLADPRLDTAQTFVTRLETESLDRIATVYAELEAEGRAALRREFGDGTVTLERIPLAETDDAARLRERFDGEYVRRYGHANAAAEVEVVALHSLATLHMQRPEIARLAGRGGKAAAAQSQTRPVFFLEEDRFLPTQVYDRYALAPGSAGRGPALIVEYGSSTLVGPHDTFAIGKLGEIDIDCRH
jgi:N-methylhydantoinase A